MENTNFRVFKKQNLLKERTISLVMLFVISMPSLAYSMDSELKDQPAPTARFRQINPPSHNTLSSEQHAVKKKKKTVLSVLLLAGFLKSKKK